MICPKCGSHIPDNMLTEEFVICPYCEEDVEVPENG